MRAVVGSDSNHMLKLHADSLLISNLKKIYLESTEVHQYAISYNTWKTPRGEWGNFPHRARLRIDFMCL